MSASDTHTSYTRSRVQFDNLNHDNYEFWEHKMKLLLIREKLWTYVIQDPPTDPDKLTEWTTKDLDAWACIGMHVNDKYNKIVKKTTTAKGAWQALKKHHQKASLSNKVLLLKEICQLSLGEGGNMEDHIDKFERMTDKLAAFGENMKENFAVAMLLCSLPESYETLITTMESKPEEELTLEFVKCRLTDEFKKRQNLSKSTDSAMKVKVSLSALPEAPNPYNNGSGNALPQTKVCFYCKKLGHLKSECLKLKAKNAQREQANKVTNGDDSDLVFFAALTPISKEDWFIDSGASSHMSNNRSFFTSFEDVSGRNVHVANGVTCEVRGKGSGYLQCIVNDEIVKVRVDDVLYVPSFDSNLLSVRKITKRGLKVLFEDNSCVIKDKKGEKILAVGDAKDSSNLFKLKVFQDKAHVAAIRAQDTEHRQRGWDKRLGHSEPKAIKFMAQKGLAVDLKLEDCESREKCVCCIGKCVRLPIPKEACNKKSEVSLGHSQEPKINRLLDKQTNKVHISRDVVFLHDAQVDVKLEQSAVESCVIKFDRCIRAAQLDDTRAMSKVLSDKTRNNESSSSRADSPVTRKSERESAGSPPLDIAVIHEFKRESVVSPLSPPAAPTVEEGSCRSHHTFRVPPDRYMATANAAIEEPTFIVEALSGSKRDKRVAAMNNEIDSLLKNNTWEYVELPDRRDFVTNKWVFKLYRSSGGDVIKYKDRILARGFSQEFGKGHDEVFAPVIRQTTLQAFPTLAGREGLTVHHFDAKTIFVNGVIKESIYGLNQPALSTQNSAFIESVIEKFKPADAKIIWFPVNTGYL